MVTYEECEQKLIELVQVGNGRGKIAEYFDISPSKAEKWIRNIKRTLNGIAEYDDTVQFEGVCEQVVYLMEQGYGKCKIAEHFNIRVDRATRWIRRVRNNMNLNDLDAFTETVSLAKSKQRLMDKNRIREKVLRESFRVENAVEEYNKETLNVFGKHSLSSLVKFHRTDDGTAAGIIHVSDVHFNEMVDIPNVNKYDFNKNASRYLTTQSIIDIKQRMKK